MSIRTICVQYIGGGSILELPVTSENESLADALGIPCAKRALEHEVRKVVVYQPDERRQEFVPVGNDNKVLNVLLENPDLPIMLLTPDGDGEYDTYYHEGISADVQQILMARNLKRWSAELFDGLLITPWHKMNHFRMWGLNEDKYYTDEGDVAEEVTQFLMDMWGDCAQCHGMSTKPLAIGESNDYRLTTFCGYGRDYTIGDLAENVAWKVVESMPWKDYVIISACL